jgi:hypothetical protein
VWVGIRIHRLNKLRKIEGVIGVSVAYGAGKRSTQGTHTGPPHQGFDYAVHSSTSEGRRSGYRLDTGCSQLKNECGVDQTAILLAI